MDTDVKAARRNLLIVCSTFWVYHIGGGELGDSPKLPFVSITLSNPDALYWVAYGVFLWLSWRYWQYASKEMERLRVEFHNNAALTREQQQILAGIVVQKELAAPQRVEQVSRWRTNPHGGGGRYGTRGGVFLWQLDFQGLRSHQGGNDEVINGALLRCSLPWKVALGIKLKRLLTFSIRNPALVEVILPYIAMAATAGLCIWKAFFYFS